MRGGGNQSSLVAADAEKDIGTNEIDRAKQSIRAVAGHAARQGLPVRSARRAPRREPHAERPMPRRCWVNNLAVIARVNNRWG